MGPSVDTIRDLTSRYRDTQQDQIDYRNYLWKDVFLPWMDANQPLPVPQGDIRNVRGWYEVFYKTISDQGCTIPKSAPHLIKWLYRGVETKNYTDVYYPNGNVIVRVFEEQYDKFYINIDW